jgi:DNA-directed RNA polymerase subunit RPC12/RpoP
VSIIRVCASCAEPIVWLNGEPYSSAELAEFGMRCDRCGGVMHSDCGDNPHAEWKVPFVWLCLRCYDEFFLAFLARERLARP